MTIETIPLARDSKRNFLFLQGPHGPFFRQLARRLESTGATCWRAGFNKGDEVFWNNRATYIAHRDRLDEWPEHLMRILLEKNITDVVLYGDTRPVHAVAVVMAKTAGLTLHVFEEGYLRPKWITYERGGSNANSDLMETDIPQMAGWLGSHPQKAPRTPEHWGDLKQHVFYGALYHWQVLTANRWYPEFKSHREVSVSHEFAIYLKRLFLMPAHWIRRFRATRTVRKATFPYHVVLMQLAHDASFLAHSDYGSMVEFLEDVIGGFAQGAPGHHHIVFKAHPLDDGRVPASREIAALAKKYGIRDRVHFVPGGKLATLLDPCQSAVTVNSTAGQQVLWRGLPLKALGRSVYCKPELVSQQPLAEFFEDPQFPDQAAYEVFRQYLLETSQVAGGFYSASGRRILSRHIVDKMLAPPTEQVAIEQNNEAAPQHLHLVS